MYAYILYTYTSIMNTSNEIVQFSKFCMTCLFRITAINNAALLGLSNQTIKYEDFLIDYQIY